MRFRKVYDIKVIEDISLNTLKEFSKENEIELNIHKSKINVWAIFSLWYGIEHELSMIQSKSFAYMVTYAINGKGVDFFTSPYFDEKEIKILIDNAYQYMKKKEIDEEEIIRELFNYILKIYSEDLERFSFNIFKIGLRISEPLYDKFMKIEGKNKAEKMRKLIKDYET